MAIICTFDNFEEARAALGGTDTVAKSESERVRWEQHYRSATDNVLVGDFEECSREFADSTAEELNPRRGWPDTPETRLPGRFDALLEELTDRLHRPHMRARLALKGIGSLGVEQVTLSLESFADLCVLACNTGDPKGIVESDSFGYWNERTFREVGTLTESRRAGNRATRQEIAEDAEFIRRYVSAEILRGRKHSFREHEFADLLGLHAKTARRRLCEALKTWGGAKESSSALNKLNSIVFTQSRQPDRKSGRRRMNKLDDDVCTEDFFEE